ncbi:hypothetical protein H9Q72_001653 [Fusarium xylarioides]|uniref:Amidohydrolase n=1 Tax=Fusarium xylarioides TaxID=221167 RepID=A0A9P7L5R8_9HYPO|nr:hypothetical protein H9Q72_001653 [Fusarium xylarioides]
MCAASTPDCLGDIVRRQNPDLEPFEQAYRQIHENAELSEQESSTAQHVASFLATLDFEAIRGIGGKGVVGILRNGKGQTVLLRAELDGLPIQEDTGLPYASMKRMADSWGRHQPTMHACGHDMHMACLMAAASLLNNGKTEWSGTLIALFQPNEEHTGGAKALVEGGLYDRVPIPDVILGQHSGPFQAGNINIRGGPVLESADTMHIKIYSSLGHPANSQVNIDPVKLASNIIVQLDSLVDKIAGDQYAHAGVDEIHAGYPGQDWLSHVDLTLDVKAYDDAIRLSLLDRIGDLIRE